MASGSTIESGIFTQGATAVPQYLNLRFDPDWINIYNMTALAGGAAANTATQFSWSGFMGQNQASVTYYNAAATALLQSTSQALAAAGGAFAGTTGVTFIDTSAQLNGAPIAATRIDNGNPPLLYTGNTAGLVAAGAGIPGSVVRLVNPANNVGTRQFQGLDFSVGTIVANTTFQLKYAPQVVNAVSNFFYVQIPTFGSFYPRTRYISSITQAANAVIKLTVQHGYQVGEQIRIGVVPVQYGMTQISGLSATVLAVDLVNNTITTDINSTAFTAFAYPLDAVAAALNYQWPQVIPFGENTAAALSLGAQVLGDSMIDQGFLGLVLNPGIASPGGQANDTVVWVAGNSINIF